MESARRICSRYVMFFFSTLDSYLGFVGSIVLFASMNSNMRVPHSFYCRSMYCYTLSLFIFPKAFSSLTVHTSYFYFIHTSPGRCTQWHSISVQVRHEYEAYQTRARCLAVEWRVARQKGTYYVLVCVLFILVLCSVLFLLIF